MKTMGASNGYISIITIREGVWSYCSITRERYACNRSLFWSLFQSLKEEIDCFWSKFMRYSYLQSRNGWIKTLMCTSCWEFCIVQLERGVLCFASFTCIGIVQFKRVQFFWSSIIVWHWEGNECSTQNDELSKVLRRLTSDYQGIVHQRTIVNLLFLLCCSSIKEEHRESNNVLTLKGKVLCFASFNCSGIVQLHRDRSLSLGLSNLRGIVQLKEDHSIEEGSFNWRRIIQLKRDHSIGEV